MWLLVESGEGIESDVIAIEKKNVFREVESGEGIESQERGSLPRGRISGRGIR